MEGLCGLRVVEMEQNRVMKVRKEKLFRKKVCFAFIPIERSSTVYLSKGKKFDW